MKTINRVLMLRTYRGLSQKAVAAAMQISQARYSKLERNPHIARLGTLERLAQALGTSVSFFTDDTIDFEALDT